MGGAVGPKNESRLMERVKLSKALMYVSVVLGEGVGLKVEERPSRGLILVRGRDCLAEGGRRSWKERLVTGRVSKIFGGVSDI